MTKEIELVSKFGLNDKVWVVGYRFYAPMLPVKCNIGGIWGGKTVYDDDISIEYDVITDNKESMGWCGLCQRNYFLRLWEKEMFLASLSGRIPECHIYPNKKECEKAIKEFTKQREESEKTMNRLFREVVALKSKK